MEQAMLNLHRTRQGSVLHLSEGHPPRLLDAARHLAQDELRDKKERLAAQENAFIFEDLPTQRARTFSSYLVALECDAIEQGILPLTNAIFQLGGYPQFSCEGHPEGEEAASAGAYVCFWAPSTDDSFWGRVLAKLPDQHLTVFTFERNDAGSVCLGSPFTGKEGTFHTLRVKVRASVKKRMRPPSQQLKQAFNKALEVAAQAIQREALTIATDENSAELMGSTSTQIESHHG